MDTHLEKPLVFSSRNGPHILSHCTAEGKPSGRIREQGDEMVAILTCYVKSPWPVANNSSRRWQHQVHTDDPKQTMRAGLRTRHVRVVQQLDDVDPM